MSDKLSVWGSVNVKVDIKPVMAAEAIIEHLVGQGNYVAEDNGKYYIWANGRRFDFPVEEITKEHYEAIKGVEKAISFIKERDKKEKIN